MARRRPDPATPEQPPTTKPSRRSWSTRIAWLVLVGGIVVVATRVSVATVVQVHGDGMAPTILDGDHVLFVRGSWGLTPGDIVVYDPTPNPRPEPSGAIEASDQVQQGPGDPHPAAGRDIGAPLRNTAVVDPEELERNWQRTQKRSGLTPDGLQAGYRVGRILAVPGDEVVFNVPEAALGLAINDRVLAQKPGEPMRIVLGNPGRGTSSGAAEPSLRATAFESVNERRYTVLRSSTSAGQAWPALHIPDADEGPVQVRAEGYLVLADNRDEGACCDSRALGWISEDHIRGEILLRLAGDVSATPDLHPEARGSRWLP